jgi:large subunit ribosomal protein L22
MGARKREAADARKEAKKNIAVAKLNNYPTSPRKMRLIADLIRGKEVFKALNILKFSAKEPARPLEKLLRSAVANWEAKTGSKIDEGKAFVQTIFVDGGRMLKRIKPAPQGRAYRVRKRSNHVTVILGSFGEQENMTEEKESATEETITA